MRDPNRIEPFLAEVARLWHKMPDMRFAQLMICIPFERDPFFLEEDEFLAAMRNFFKEDV